MMRFALTSRRARTVASLMVAGLIFAFAVPLASAATSGPAFALYYSTSTSRTNRIALDGASVSGNIAIFTSTGSNIASIDFYLDDPNMRGPIRHTEVEAPYDFQTADAANRATLFNAASLNAGTHTITIRRTNTTGVVRIITATFKVVRSQPTPVPPTVPPVTVRPPITTPPITPPVTVRPPAAPPVTTRPPTTTPTPPPVTTPPVNTPPVTTPPVMSGFPSPTNTGVRSGTNLVTHNGDLHITVDGTVIDSQLIKGTIGGGAIAVVIVEADNVTIKNSRIECQGREEILRVLPTSNNFRLEDSTLIGNSSNGCGAGVDPDGTNQTYLRNNISGVSNGLEGEGSFLVQDNYIRVSLAQPGAHLDGIQIGGLNNGPFVIHHNTIVNSVNQTSCIFLSSDYGQLRNVTIENNLLDGGGYTVYGGGTGSTNVKFLNNTFGKTYFANGGNWGPVAYWSAGVGNQWTGNHWLDGSPINPS